jgi:prepilin-type N-terminal cleavage/methylation domain-containing protein
MRTALKTDLKGFSLIELAVVLVIIALMAGSVMTLMNRHLDTNRYDKTAETLKRIEEALQRQVMISGYLPCPAALNAAPSSATYGVATDCNAAAPAGTTDISAIAGTADDIRIGAVPTRTLNLPDNMLMDAWNMRLTYVVVKDLAIDTTKFNAYVKPASGGVTVTDATGNPALDPAQAELFSAYAVLSHGNDKKGATVLSGGSATACTAGNMDSENCDGDSTFIDTAFNNSTTIIASFFDDLIVWKPYYLINPSLKY